MDLEFGLKELTDITLKATYPIEIEGRYFEEGEVVARFDKIQLANFRELVERVSATGGFNNQRLVTWETTKEMELSFSQGIFSKRQFALLNNANLLFKKDSQIYISHHLTTESDEQGKIQLGKNNVRNIFIYNYETGEKIQPVAKNCTSGELTIDAPYQNVEIDFEYNYSNQFITMVVGQKLIKGYLCFEGKTKVKDDLNGQVRSAILRIPRLKLMSDLSMRLGREATPIVGNFNAIGVPTGERGKERVMELIFLEDDIDADM